MMSDKWKQMEGLHRADGIPTALEQPGTTINAPIPINQLNKLGT